MSARAVPPFLAEYMAESPPRNRRKTHKISFRPATAQAVQKRCIRKPSSFSETTTTTTVIAIDNVDTAAASGVKFVLR